MSDTRVQLDLPHVFEGPPDPQPKPDARKAVAVTRKPPEREDSTAHPLSSHRVA